MSAEFDRALERIKKLMNTKGRTEDEAATAMKLAAGIAAKHGIDMEKLRPADAPKPKIMEKNNWQTLKVYESFCAEAAAVLYGVECRAPNYGKYGFNFVGREENVELAEQTMMWLVEQVEALYKEALPRGLSKRDRANFRGSFKDACGQRIYERARALIREMKTNPEAAQAVTGHNALVVAGHFDMLAEEIVQHYRDKREAANLRYQKIEEERKERERQRLEAEQQKIAMMPEEERVAYLKKKHDDEVRAQKELEREQRREARRAAKRKGDFRHRNPKRGSGTSAGYAAGDRVKLREELK